MNDDRRPLNGCRIVEFGGLGPTPFAAMLLADLGAEVVRIERAGSLFSGTRQTYHRGRPAVQLDLKDPADRERALRYVQCADASIEGFRPGVMERLGLGPEDCWELNPRLVYCRMTGWGQNGPWADRAGHDINYLAVTGALNSFRRRGEAPVPPMNLLGDFCGGSLYLVLGLLSGLLDARATGCGSLVDAAIVDGVASMMASVCGRLHDGSWNREPGTNLLDSGAPFYRVYETADGAHMAVGAIEPSFYEALVDVLGLSVEELPAQHDREAWPETAHRFSARFKARTRDEWVRAFEGVDACVTPVLSIDEAFENEHLRARGTFRDEGFGPEPAPAPRMLPMHRARRTAPPTDGPLRSETLQREDER